MKRYYVPDGTRGSVNRGTERYPITDGVCALPADLALELGWPEAKPIAVTTPPSGGSSKPQTGADPGAGGNGGNGEPHPILSMNADDAAGHVASAGAEELETIEIAELANRKNPGGRKTVLNAIVERRKALINGGN